ncbi:MAG: 2TM domain-containing protein [Bacteroidota bacterium]
MKACHRSHKEDMSREEKFRKSLRSFLGFNFFIFILMVLGMGSSVLWKISVIWGAILAMRGYSIFGKEDDAPRREDEPSREQYGRPRRPQWKDKDLV